MSMSTWNFLLPIPKKMAESPGWSGRYWQLLTQLSSALLIYKAQAPVAEKTGRHFSHGPTVWKQLVLTIQAGQHVMQIQLSMALMSVSGSGQCLQQELRLLTKATVGNSIHPMWCVFIYKGQGGACL